MSCNYPMLAVKGPQMPSGRFKRIPLGRYTPELKRAYPDAVAVPCGKCAGCRADYTRQWADRMILELDHSGKAVFVTLTYNDEHLPVMINPVTGQAEMTLSKRDWQLFMKRFRKYFRGKEIRYYVCGEYGTLGRPHYHAIIFGVDLADFPDLQRKGVNELGQDYFISNDLAENVWKNGFCLLAKVSWKTCAYVARYVRKKQFGEKRDEFIDRHKEPVFALSSRKPGIGMYYPIEHPDYLRKSKIYLSDFDDGSVQIWLPDAFLKLYEQQDPEGYVELKKKRAEFADNVLMAKLASTDNYFDELCDRNDQKISKSGEYIDRLQKL